jgi:hypothetical protein
MCGTDVHIIKGEHQVRPGLILGHEPVGVIDTLGEGLAHEYEAGQRVIVGAITPCGQCFSCLNGSHAQCGGPAGGWRFGNTINGAWAEFLLVPDAAPTSRRSRQLDGRTGSHAADIASTGLSGAENADIKVGDAVAVFAQGPIGLCATLGAARAARRSSWRGSAGRATGDGQPLRRVGDDRPEGARRRRRTEAPDRRPRRRCRHRSARRQRRSKRRCAPCEPGRPVELGRIWASERSYEAFYAGLGDQRILTTLCPGGRSGCGV